MFSRQNLIIQLPYSMVDLDVHKCWYVWHENTPNLFPARTKDDNLVIKSLDFRWLSKKLHMRGVRYFYHFGVLEYVVMIEILQQRSKWRVFTTPSKINVPQSICPPLLVLYVRKESWAETQWNNFTCLENWHNVRYYVTLCHKIKNYRPPYTWVRNRHSRSANQNERVQQF